MKRIACFLILCCLWPLSLARGEECAVFDPAVYEGRLAIWFFSLPGEEHTGESILVRAPDGACLLIDGGVPEAGPQVNAYLERLKVTRLNAVLATHMHVDHIGGLPAVLAGHAVGTLYTSPFTEYATLPTANLKAAAAAQGLDFTPLLAGDSFALGDTLVEVLSPAQIPSPSNPQSITGDFLNDSSVVCRLSYGGIRFLFTGDATRAIEGALIEKYGDDLRADVAKVPHHGSSDASSRPFVQTVGAKDSVMCVYAFNDFGIYDRYKKMGNRPWVTSLDGTVLCVTDGEQVIFYAEKERQGMLK